LRRCLPPFAVPRPPAQSPLFPYTTLFRSTFTYQWYRQPAGVSGFTSLGSGGGSYSGTTSSSLTVTGVSQSMSGDQFQVVVSNGVDRKSTRLNSSHDQTSYAVFGSKKKKTP